MHTCAVLNYSIAVARREVAFTFVPCSWISTKNKWIALLFPAEFEWIIRLLFGVDVVFVSRMLDSK